MNKYLTKISEWTDRNTDALSLGIAGAVAADRTGILAHRKASRAFLNTNYRNAATEQQTERAKVIVGRKTNTTFDPHEFLKGGNPDSINSSIRGFRREGPFFAHKQVFTIGGKHPSHNYINLPKGIHLPPAANSNLADFHEMGHALDYHNNPWKSSRTTYKIRGLLSHKYSRLGSTAVSAGMLSNDKTRNYAWTVPIAQHALTLSNEVGANVHGHRLLKHVGGDTKMYRRFAAKQLGGYAAKPIMAAATLYGAAKLINMNEKRRNV